MKRSKTSEFITRLLQYNFFCFVLLVTFNIPLQVFAQTDSAQAVVAEEELISPSILFISTQKSDNTIDLKATFQAKIKGSFTKLSGLRVEFFSSGDSSDTKIGEAVTNRSGIAKINAKQDILVPDKTGTINLKVAFAGNTTTETAEEVLAIKKARLEMTTLKEDSVLSVQLKLIDLSSGEETVVPETNLGVFVQRMFSPLRIGEGTTDESGGVTLEIPNNLPGDAKGNITLLAKLEDNEVYGNLEATAVQQWGTPVSDKVEEMPRALWSAHPPLWMVITFVVLMTVVWGHYIVIVYQLFRLRKEQG